MKCEIYICDVCGSEGRSPFVVREQMPYDEVSTGTPKGWKYIRPSAKGKDKHEYMCSRPCFEKRVAELVELLYREQLNSFWVIGR